MNRAMNWQPVVVAAALALSGCASAGAPEPMPSTAAPAQSSSPTLSAAVSLADAVAAAQAAVPGQLIAVEFDYSPNVSMYTVSIITPSDDVDVIVDAATGEIVRQDAEPIDADDVEEIRLEALEIGGVVEPEEATAAALLAQDGAVTGWTLEREPQGIVYSVDVQSSQGDVDVDVDASTGSVLGIDT